MTCNIHKGHSAKYVLGCYCQIGGMVDVNRDALYSLDELSQMMGVSVRTLQRYVSDGELPVRRLGKRVYVVGSDLLDKLPAGASPPTQKKRPARKRKTAPAGDSDA
jgi:Predicted site-specific integrase-resolvase